MVGGDTVTETVKAGVGQRTGNAGGPPPAGPAVPADPAPAGPAALAAPAAPAAPAQAQAARAARAAAAAPGAGAAQLLTAADVDYELRRLVGRLVAGSRLLRRGPGHDDGATPAVDVLLDLEVDGVRCLLTRRRVARNTGVRRLTAREREVAQMVAVGLTNAAIAGKLELSPWTVSTHLRRIFAKLDVPTRAAMVAVLADDAAEPRR